MPYFLIGKKELEKQPELINKLCDLLVEDSAEERGKLSFNERHIGSKKANEIVHRIIKKFRSVFLISLNSKGKPEGFMMLDFPPHKSRFVPVMHTFVSKDFRRKGVASRLTFRLLAEARMRGYWGVQKGLRAKGAIKLGEKLLANPRRIFGEKGKSTGRLAERIEIHPDLDLTRKNPDKIMEIEPIQRKPKRTMPK